MTFARRLPIYLLVDSSSASALKRSEQAIRDFITSLSCDPQALETGYLSVITFASEARQIIPLTELIKVQLRPDQLSPAPSLRSGLMLLRECIEREVRRRTESSKGGFKTLVLIFSSEELTESDRLLADPDKLASFLRIDCGSDFDFRRLNEDLMNVIRSYQPGFDTEMAPESLPLASPPLPPPPPTLVSGHDDENSEPALDAYSRRLPIYVLVDISKSMAGAAMNEATQGLRTLIDDLRMSPRCLETAHISVIVFDQNAQQVNPLTEVIEFQLPPLRMTTEAVPENAFRFLSQCIQRDVRESTPESKGDWKPAVFLFTNGRRPDEFETEARLLQQTLYFLCVVGCGPDADFEMLRRVSEIVVPQASFTGDVVSRFFQITS